MYSPYVLICTALLVRTLTPTLVSRKLNDGPDTSPLSVICRMIVQKILSYFFMRYAASCAWWFRDLSECCLHFVTEEFLKLCGLLYIIVIFWNVRVIIRNDGEWYKKSINEPSVYFLIYYKIIKSWMDLQVPVILEVPLAFFHETLVSIVFCVVLHCNYYLITKKL